jgi:uncharacterized protein
MTQPAKGPEPSMEEILASIRRIISDEPTNRHAAAEIRRNDSFRREAVRVETLRTDSFRGEAPDRKPLRQDNGHNDHPGAETLRAETLRADSVRGEISQDFDQEEKIPAAVRDEPPLRPLSRAESTSAARAPFAAQPSARNDELSARLPSLRETSGSSVRLTTPAPEPKPVEEEIDEMLATLHTSRQASAAPEQEEEEQVESVPTEACSEPKDIPDPHVADEEEDSAAEAFEPAPAVVTATRNAHVAQPARPRAEESRERRGANYPGAEPRLVSAATSAAVDSAFSALAETVLVQNGRTLEDLVREMLRPMLKTWLDDNLPRMVERLVRAEIERVSRGRPS